MPESKCEQSEMVKGQKPISTTEITKRTTAKLSPGNTLKRRRTDGCGEAKRSLVDNVHVRKIAPLVPPCCIKEEIPLTDTVAETVCTSRGEVFDIIEGTDDRLICVVGPCSIHDVKMGREYALKLRRLAVDLKKELLVVMRVYFEKPRTTVGWKGLINDPHLDGTFKINHGIRLARKLLVDINELGLPCGVEFLDTISPQFLADLVSWGAIGARTTESQVHRELASGLSMPVGFKNSTGGNVQVAVDAVRSARCPHAFLGVTGQGVTGIVHTEGNPGAHIILRGGRSGKNFNATSIASHTALCKKAGLEAALIVDCSHANSGKIHTNQPLVSADVAAQVAAGQGAIRGVMVESNLRAGKQTLKPGVTHASKLKYGVSVTDACIDIPTTEKILRELAAAVLQRRALKKQSGATPMDS